MENRSDQAEGPQQRRRSPPPLLQPVHIQETALDLEPVVINMPSATAPPPSEPISTMAHIGAGDTFGAPSPSSSEGSSNGFVKVEHGDVQHSVGSGISGLMPIRMEDLIRLHDVEHDRHRTDAHLHYSVSSELPFLLVLPFRSFFL
ncbi:unnamed protein product [Gongylonema pulchrum]|uniref:Uncharacterized protein n=1 Tax=Gongylonema pulchrum TaxID=637853 RepID=A0A183DS02_9BILA|nr:unnamed protein product [Gongylonema pulchrum]